MRGLVCVPCNNRLMHVETGLGPALPEWQLPALAAHLMKCPECREQPGCATYRNGTAPGDGGLSPGALPPFVVRMRVGSWCLGS